ncbi:molybdopterin molybdotransferase MoeA [Pontivivens insulae]|uniref:Molybdopterin molybdenumtransferase n=1 Tax=Pontivivens insulae TaxID=1639689 RepID=A0A2R8AB47_9RHOB|nr:gephyrin-like molybdotransferase Glp [Pontivivens insulae]RED13223.1 molybdopterin molybdotransferase [Pontivivens insulae]SPF29315.1 Molybdopterin molybdenumtransferase [Pontivivens insulae]
MITVDEALSHLFSLCRVMPGEVVPLVRAEGRVLSDLVAAQRTQPPFPASAMDGYAVRSADIVPGATLRVLAEIPAGGAWHGTVTAGTAVRIFTGAPVPEGADRILIQEDVRRDGDTITVGDNLDESPYLRPAGGDFEVGDTLDICRISPARQSLLAAMNIAHVPVRRQPRVALIATGDELVVPGEAPGPSQIVSSNIYGVASILRAQGALPHIMPIARDTAQSLSATLALASDCDLVVTLGGASVGDHDVVAQVLGGEMSFNKVRMRPGKPLMAGRFQKQMIVGLPGNPVSALVCAHVFLRPLIDAMLGLPQRALPRRSAALSHDLGANGGREHYMRALVSGDTVKVFDRQDSSLLSVIANANALVVREPNAPPLKQGARVPFVPLSDL